MPDSISTSDSTDRSLEKQPSGKKLNPSSASPAVTDMSSTTQAQSSSTASELIETVSRAIKQLYKERLGKAPLLVTCNLLADRLVIWIEGSITPVEKLLFADGTPEAKSLCFTVDNIMRQHLTDVIERHLNVDVVTMIADTCYEHDCTGAIAKLSAPITSL